MKTMSTYQWRWIFLFSAIICFNMSALADTEPNNVIAEANALALNTVQNGDLFTNPANDLNDWYEVNVPSDGSITITGSYSESLTGYIYFYNGNGAQLGYTLVSGTSFSVSYDCIASGTVFIKASRSSGSGDYSLEVNSDGPTHANDAEPNSVIAEIQETYDEGEIWTGHLGYSNGSATDLADYYNIVSPHDGNVTLEATYDPGLSGYIYLYEKDGSLIGFTYITGNTGVFTANCYQGDTLIARISRSSGCGSFTASFSTTDPIYENDIEPNNDGPNVISSIEAIQLTFEENEEWEGHLGYLDVDDGLDNDDYYYIISPEDGSVTLSAEYVTGLAGYIYLYEKDGTLIGYTYLAGVSGTVTANCYASDTLVARINRNSGCGSYISSFYTTGITYDNDVEPNDDGAAIISSIETIQMTFIENEEWEGHLGYIDVDDGMDSDDYYYIISPEDGDVSLSAEYEPGLAGYIYLYEKDGTLIGYTYLAGVSGVVTANCYASDTLVARINRNSGCGSYLASFGTSELTYENDLELNNSLETAIVSANHETNEGHLGYIDADIALDVNDWYQISVVDVPFDLEAKLYKGEPFAGYLYLHNEGGTVLGWVYHSGVGETAYTATIEDPGIYYLQVNRTSGCGSYALGDFCGNYPEVSASAGGPTDICLGESVLLSAVEGLFAYSWRRNGNEVGTGQTLLATEQGTYEVFGYNSNGCAGISDEIEVTYLADSDSDGICDVDDNCPNTPGLIGDACDDGDDATENDILDESCQCIGTPIAIASQLILDCGESVIQISWAQAGLNDGGTAISETRTVYAFAPDNGNPTSTYEGGSWPYVIISGSLNTDPNITAELTTNDDNVLLVNGWPAYQYAGDPSANDANGTFGPWSYYLTNGDQSQNACVGDIVGSVDWNLNCGDRNVDLDIYEAGTTNLIESYTTTLNSDGDFDIEEIEVGTVDIYLKVEGYLATSISSSEIIVGLNSLDFGSLQAGDLNGDNGVNIIDVSALNAAFGSSLGSGNYNPLADMNCDGNVNIIDVSILNAGFGMTGDSPAFQ